jgi:hypothetical protein
MNRPPAKNRPPGRRRNRGAFQKLYRLQHPPAPAKVRQTGLPKLVDLALLNHIQKMHHIVVFQVKELPMVQFGLKRFNPSFNLKINKRRRESKETSLTPY